jgi:hypothetical protein
MRNALAQDPTGSVEMVTAATAPSSIASLFNQQHREAERGPSYTTRCDVTDPLSSPSLGMTVE